MAADGLERMLDYLNGLKEKKIHYFIEHHSDDYLTATITFVGVRVEVMFSVDDITFSLFRGSEDVRSDLEVVEELIREHTS